jgi:integrase
MSQKLTKTKTPGIYKRESGSYMVSWKDAEGRQHTRTLPTYEEAKAHKRKADEARSKGSPGPIATRETVEEYLIRWIESYQGRTSHGLRPETRKEYRLALTKWIIPRIGDVRLNRLTRAKIKTLAADLAVEGLKPTTVRKTLAPLRAALSDAVEDKLIAINPADGLVVAEPRTHDDERPGLSDEQVATIIENAPERHRMMILVAALTGVRRSELLGLQWQDLDHDAGTISIPRRYRERNVGPTKSAAGERTIPVEDDLLRDLGTMRGTSMYPADGDYIFAGASGAPLSAQSAHDNALKPAVREAGVPWAAFHDLRRAALTRWIMADLPPHIVKRLAGHERIETTLSIYAKVRPGDMPTADRLGLSLSDA